MGRKFDFDMAFHPFFEEQVRHANGRRLEMLTKDLTGEVKMLREAIWPVFKSFEGFTLEHEIKSTSGISIFADAFYHPLRFVFESDGFVAHAEKITRDRFSFERMRMRTFALYGYKYVPFSWDELEKNPDACRRTIYELLGRYTSSDDRALQELTVFEREVLRYILRLNRPFRISDICYCLQLGYKGSRKVVKGLLEKGLIRSKGRGTESYMEFFPSDDQRFYYRNHMTKGYIVLNLHGKVVSCDPYAFERNFEQPEKKTLSSPSSGEQFVHPNVTRWMSNELSLKQNRKFGMDISRFLQEYWGPIVNFNFDELKVIYPFGKLKATYCLYLYPADIQKMMAIRFIGDEIVEKRCSYEKYRQFMEQERELTVKDWRVISIIRETLEDDPEMLRMALSRVIGI